jgi:hypothetical protein
MGDDEVRNAYEQAVQEYDAAKAGRGDRVKAFIQFLTTERMLACRANATMNEPLHRLPLLVP